MTTLLQTFFLFKYVHNRTAAHHNGCSSILRGKAQTGKSIIVQTLFSENYGTLPVLVHIICQEPSQILLIITIILTKMEQPVRLQPALMFSSTEKSMKLCRAFILFLLWECFHLLRNAFVC
jgi:hypothetical protein